MDNALDEISDSRLGRHVTVHQLRKRFRDLQARAFPPGQRIYAEKPKYLVRRFAA